MCKIAEGLAWEFNGSMFMKKKFQIILANNYGFHHPHPLMYVTAIVGILAALIVPNYVQYIEKDNSTKDVNCIKTMINIVRGSDMADAKCPVSGSPYRPFEVDGQLTVSCPGPVHHLKSWPEISYSDHGLSFRQAYVEFNPRITEHNRVAERITFIGRENAVTLTKRVGWGRYFLLSLAIVFMALGFVLPLCRGIVRLIFDKNAINPLFSLLACAFTTLICFIIVRPVFKTEVYRFSKSDRFVELQNFYAGKRFSDPEIISDIIAVVPLRLRKDRMVLSILYETDQDIQYKKLFEMDSDMLGIVTVLNQALINSDRLAATGTSIAPTAILQSK
jgi:hypothetical protein